MELLCKELDLAKSTSFDKLNAHPCYHLVVSEILFDQSSDCATFEDKIALLDAYQPQD